MAPPETQVIIPMIKSDLYPILEAASKSQPFTNLELESFEGSCLGVVLASGGYPGPYAKGEAIYGLDKTMGNTLVFHAGTKYDRGNLVTDGGRVLTVVCRGADVREAAQKTYEQVLNISFKNMHYRKDIGKKAWRK